MHRLGTIGFVYDDWSGVFYPRGLKPTRRLGWYAQHFSSLELDTTFHAVPPAERVRRWAESVPEGFTFSVKTPRAVTHEGPLGTVAVGDVMRLFLKTVRELGDRLGVVLMQFPPRFRAERRDELGRFLRRLPADIRFAVELRHPSWWSDATADLLRERRIAWVGSDQPTPEVAGVSPADTLQGGAAHRPRPVIVTSDFLYIRWVGNHGQFGTRAQEKVDPTPRLRWWADQLQPLMGQSGPTPDLYGYFGNSYAGHAPATCRRMHKLLGLPTPSGEAAQGSLF